MTRYLAPSGKSTVLAIYHKQIGDLVLLESALRRLAHATDSAVDLITRSGFQPLVSLMNGVRFRRRPALRRYDVLWCFDDRKKSSFFSFVSQAREKNLLISPGMAIRWYHRGIFSDITAPDLGRLYLAEFNWRYTELGDGNEFVPPTLQPPPQGWEFPLKSKQYLHVNPTSGWKSKNWTVEKWARTIDTLTKIGIGPIVMTSGAKDWQKEHCEQICRRLKYPIENVSGLTTLENYLSIVWNAKLVLTVEGSAGHIAAAYRHKCVTLFGHTSLAHLHRSTPYSYAISTGKVLGQECRLEHLPEEPVITAVVELWNANVSADENTISFDQRSRWSDQGEVIARNPRRCPVAVPGPRLS
jgi:ADP-heptose:LPS heptosyltransferase